MMGEPAEMIAIENELDRVIDALLGMARIHEHEC